MCIWSGDVVKTMRRDCAFARRSRTPTTSAIVSMVAISTEQASSTPIIGMAESSSMEMSSSATLTSGCRSESRLSWSKFGFV